MHTATRGRPSTYAPGDGSRTQTITNDPTQEEGDEQGLDSEDGQVVGSLRLRGGQRRTQRVAWNDDVVDNEGCGKKKSKICCIYHKPKRFDESSDESSDSDSDVDHGHNHNHTTHNHQPMAGPSSSVQQTHSHSTSTVIHELAHDEHVEPNAYEKQPPKKGKRRAV